MKEYFHASQYVSKSFAFRIKRNFQEISDSYHDTLFNSSESLKTFSKIKFNQSGYIEFSQEMLGAKERSNQILQNFAKELASRIRRNFLECYKTKCFIAIM